MHRARQKPITDLLAWFQELSGSAAEGVWTAPGRVNLIGEHTDYNGGFVLPVAIAQSASVAVKRRSDSLLRLWSKQTGAVTLDLNEVRPGVPTGWAAYVAGAFWSLAQEGTQEGIELPGFDLALDSDVPLGAGLSSSAAIECATVLAAAELCGATLTRERLALVAQRAESQIAGVPCGVMDQMASLCAKPGHALFLDCRSLEHRQVSASLDAAGCVLLVIDTRAPHRLVSGEYATRRRACEEAAQLLGVAALRDATAAQVEAAGDKLGDERLRRARHVVSENARVLEAVRRLEAGDVFGLGPLLTASHASLRDDFQVTVPELDVCAEASLEAGALGARMIGGGFGGCVLALVRATDVAQVTERVRQAFEDRRFEPPVAFTAVASAGARRVA